MGSPALWNLGGGVVDPPTGFYGLPSDTVPVTAPTRTEDTTGPIDSVPGFPVATEVDVVDDEVFAVLFEGS